MYKAPGKSNTKKRSKNCSTNMRIFPVAVVVVGGGGGVVICVVAFVFVFTVMLLLLLMCPTLTAVTRFITLSWSHAQKKPVSVEKECSRTLQSNILAKTREKNHKDVYFSFSLSYSNGPR